MNPATGIRKHAKCPYCGALERHRLIRLSLDEILRERDTKKMRMLHFAPEPWFEDFYRERFGEYETADLTMTEVDHRVDIQNLPFADASYDFLLASIVLDAVPDDRQAIKEIRRVLKPNGLAALPVCLVCEKTIEYSEPNVHEAYQMRSCGQDYFDRFESSFSRVELVSSKSFAERYQLYIYEDRSRWPSKESPLRPPMAGEKHTNIVPVCYV